MKHSLDSDGGRALPLTGRTVLDFGTALAGPVCATLLGEFGADVIKVERPGLGDTLRTYGPRIDGVPASESVKSNETVMVSLFGSRVLAG